MKNKMIAIAMAAIMVVTAFAMIDMVDSDAEAANGQKVIIGSENKPYALYIDSDVTANIKYNYAAFASPVVSFTYTYTSGTTSAEAKDITVGDKERINGIDTTIASNNGQFTVTFEGAAASDNYTKIDFVLSVTDKVTVGGSGVELPTQTYTFTAYIIVVDKTAKQIKLGGIEESSITFDYETSYSISASVAGGSSDYAYRFYATGLPAGLSMRVDGKIGGMLSSTQENTPGTFTVYAVSEIGDVVKTDFEYKINSHTNRDFTISYNNDGKSYATVKDGDNVTLTITPTIGELTQIAVDCPGTALTHADGDGNTKTVSFTCNGTGTIVVTVTASVDGSLPITHTFTVYVVGHIYNTDLDPEVSSA